MSESADRKALRAAYGVLPMGSELAEVERALSQPDPCEALAIELRDMRRRFHACCVHSGSDKEFADAACEKADAALAAYEAGK